MAATPMAMPRADSEARSRRVRSPTLATRARSAGRSLAGARAVVAVTGVPSFWLAFFRTSQRSWSRPLRGRREVVTRLRASSVPRPGCRVAGRRVRGAGDIGAGGVDHDAPVEHLDLAGQPSGEAPVVSDHDDGRALGVEFLE